jgi:hypothetical protein
LAYSHSFHECRHAYTQLLCNTLNDWANNEYEVKGKTIANASIGVSLVVLEKTYRGQSPVQLNTAIHYRTLSDLFNDDMEGNRNGQIFIQKMLK